MASTGRWWWQFLEWAGHAAEGDLGRSFSTMPGLGTDPRPITDHPDAWPDRLAIALLVACRWHFGGGAGGLGDGSGHHDVALLGQAMPGFWFGLVMIVLLGLDLHGCRFRRGHLAGLHHAGDRAGVFGIPP